MKVAWFVQHFCVSAVMIGSSMVKAMDSYMFINLAINRVILLALHGGGG